MMKMSAPNSRRHRMIPIMIAAAFLVSGFCNSAFSQIRPERVSKTYGEQTRQSLDIYTDKKLKDAPVLVFVHGGGWTMGNKNQYGYLGNVFRNKGFVVVTVNYRLSPAVQFPVFVEDAAKAVKWVTTNIGDHGGDPKKIFLMGHSAGAHSVSLLGLDESYLKAEGVSRSAIRGVIPISGPLTMRPSMIPMLKPVFGEAADKKVVPTSFIDGKEPPFLLLHGVKDPLVPVDQSKGAEKSIRAKGGKAKGIYYPDHDHMTIIGAFSRKFARKGDVISPVTEFIESGGDLSKVTVK